ncbi:e3 ubiquitin- ligase ari9 [Trichoderma arundinaceum]|uniref:RBR-type E3 ubiquitin transferase n=1 Tax=Trichoderma arundinaceum TaxID=490622 RepID=A0A395NYY9_TRIAR|nr:e3 ubiquitin- ligase ari9 [Trichoderma arundinaceum]
MLRSIKRKTEAALRRRKNNRSVAQVTPVSIDWPLQNDSYPPSSSTGEQTAATTDTTETEEVLRPVAEEQLIHFKQEEASVVRTTAVEEIPSGEPTQEVDIEEEPEMDPYAAKYVPFVETSAMRNNMFVNPASSHYGTVNPAIMSGFGDDDDSIWLVDDEETDQEAENTKKSVEGEEEEGEEEEEIEGEEQEGEEEEDVEPHVSLPPTIQPPPATSALETPSTTSPQTGFRYRINLALFDDDEFTTPQEETSLPSVATHETPNTGPPAPAINTHTTEFLSVATGSRHQDGDQDETPASNGSSTPATSNPYVDLLEQQDSAMTVAYQRRLDLSGRRGDDEADDFRYETLALRAAMAEAENFFWCTSGCGSGQIHDSGHDQPIVICLHCTHRSCFHHNVAWHQGLTCEEYDQLLADPDNFRSKLEIDNEAWAASQQAQLDADRAMAQGLLEEERRVREIREMREREERERTRKAIELARQIAARRKAEEDMSRETVGRTTKPCPGCGWAIEKNEGCSHMTCAKCKHQFCYECGADHKRIIEHDNSIHEENCRFHPSQMGDLDGSEWVDTDGDEEEEEGEEEEEEEDDDDDDDDDDESGDGHYYHHHYHHHSHDEDEFEHEEEEDDEWEWED